MAIDPNVLDLVVGRTLNYTVSGEGGKSIPPRQTGGFRVASVSNLRVLSATSQASGTVFTLAWTDVADDPSQPTDHYNIYASKYINGNATPMGQYTAKSSPATMFVPADATTPVTFTVQTVLANGTMSSLSNAPTCTGQAYNPLTGLSGLSAVQVVNSLPVLPNASYPQGTVIFLTTDNKLYRSTGSTWTSYVNNADIATGTITGDRLVAGTITSGLIASGAITTGLLAAAAVDATKIDFKQIIVVGLTLTNNSPGAGQVAWSSCTVYWNGSSYAIASGNTTTTNKFIYWDATTNVFTAVDSFTPQVNRFLIATNNSGTGDEAWNKLANSGIQESNLAFTLLQGFQVQPLSTVSAIFLDGAFAVTTTILNVSPANGGVLLNVGIRNSSPGTFGNKNNTTTLRITIDGGTPETYTIYGKNTTTGFDAGFANVASKLNGSGMAVGDIITMYIGLGFVTSCLVEVLTAQDGNIGGNETIDVTCQYATKVS